MQSRDKTRTTMLESASSILIHRVVAAAHMPCSFKDAVGPLYSLCST